jgi:hypothetical protein
VRRLAALLAVAFLLTACSGKDRYLPEFGQAETLVTTNGPVTFTLAPNGDIYYAELRTNEVYVLSSEAKRLVADLHYKPDSLAVDAHGLLWAAGRNKIHQPWISSVPSPTPVTGSGPPSRFPLHIAFDDGKLIIGHDDTVVSRENGDDTLISKGWTDPVVAPGRGNRIWVADNALPGSKERVARGRERSIAKRNRFASTLPEFTNPSGMALLDDQLLVCSKTRKKVFRLHIGIDDVARRRDWMKGLVCDRDIAVAKDGSLITATRGSIVRYPPR